MSTAIAPISVQAASKTFPGGVQALATVTFSIPAGQRVCLLGPNGAGKTTLVRLLTGALEPTSGSVQLFGQSPESDGFLDAKRRTGIVPQSPGMYRDLFVREYLEMVQELYGRGRIDDTLDTFGLRPFAGRPMAQLSGGYQRRLSLAAALLSGPELLLLDEPTVGLDPVAAREIREHLRAAMTGRTTLLCTHNLAEAEELCDSVLILLQGRVLVHERIDELRARGAPRLALAAAEGPARLSEALAALGHSPQVHGAEVHLVIEDPKGQAPRLLRLLLDAGLAVHGCRVVTPSLEEMFLELVEAAT